MSTVADTPQENGSRAERHGISDPERQWQCALDGYARYCLGSRIGYRHYPQPLDFMLEDAGAMMRACLFFFEHASHL